MDRVRNGAQGQVPRRGRPVKRPTATHRIEIDFWYYNNKGKYVRSYTSHIIRIRGGRTLWSSTAQLYTRKLDALRVARAFLRAAKAGRVEVKA